MHVMEQFLFAKVILLKKRILSSTERKKVLKRSYAKLLKHRFFSHNKLSDSRRRTKINEILYRRFRFRKELDAISQKINERNKNLKEPYPYLDPKEVPNAISI